MTSAKPGDRVRVQFEGDVHHPHNEMTMVTDARGWTRIAFDEDITVIARPVEVGDKITTVDQLDRLPDWSAIRCGNRAVWQKAYGDWRSVFGAVMGNLENLLSTPSGDVVVVAVGRSEWLKAKVRWEENQ